MQEGRPLWTHRPHKKREMASLTKIMNLATILEIVNSIGIDAKELKVRASNSACQLTGTTAELRPNAEYSLYELYFGMMLPSGNDAAHLIAEVGGFLLKMQQSGTTGPLRDLNARINGEIATYSEQLVSSFLREMNRLARKLDMANSNFANPHGLSNPDNYSTATDLAKLCTASMRNLHFRRIVQTRRFTYRVQSEDKSDVETVESNSFIEEKATNWLELSW